MPDSDCAVIAQGGPPHRLSLAIPDQSWHQFQLNCSSGNEFDELARPTAINRHIGCDQVRTYEWAYDEVGRATMSRTTRTFEPKRDLIASIQNDWLVGGTTTVSKYTYYNDARGRRDGVVREGTAFGGSGGASPEHFDDWGYNDRNELTGQTRYNQPTSQPSTQPSAGQTYAYAYDPIGNRETYEFDQGGDASELAYAANGLNQYERTRFVGGKAVGQRLFYDEDGNLTHTKVIADMNCDGSVNSFDIQPFTFLLAHDCAQFEQEYDCDCLNGDTNGDGSVNPFDVDPFLGALEGGPGAEVSIPMVRFVWDGENRLREVRPLGETPAAGAVKWVYTYDYMSRRVAKQSFTWDDGEEEWDLATDTRFVYDGWNVIEELDGAQSPPAVIRKYTWGLDLSGQYGSRNDRRWAGGIGGLLGTRDVSSSDDYAYLYDANGNVGQLIDLRNEGSTPDIVAAYEYDPYGATASQSGAYADSNPFRFSTKFYDTEPGFYYYGYRSYSARLGSWLNRDPSDEAAGPTLYEFLASSPPNYFDPLGLQPDGPTTAPSQPTTSGPTTQPPLQPGQPVPGIEEHDIPMTWRFLYWDSDIHFYNYDIGHRWIKVDGDSYGYWSKGINRERTNGKLPKVKVDPKQKQKDEGTLPNKQDTRHEDIPRYYDPTLTFNHGKNKGKSCKDATKAQIVECIEDCIANYRNNNGPWLPWNSCKQLPDRCLGGCCLRK